MSNTSRGRGSGSSSSSSARSLDERKSRVNIAPRRRVDVAETTATRKSPRKRSTVLQEQRSNVKPAEESNSWRLGAFAQSNAIDLVPESRKASRSAVIRSRGNNRQEDPQLPVNLHDSSESDSSSESDNSDDSHTSSNSGSASSGRKGKGKQADMPEKSDVMFVLDDEHIDSSAASCEETDDVAPKELSSDTQDRPIDSAMATTESASESQEQERWLAQLSSAVLSMVPGARSVDRSAASNDDSSDKVGSFVAKLKFRTAETPSSTMAIWLQELAEILALTMDDYSHSAISGTSSSSSYYGLVSELLRILSEECSAENAYEDLGMGMAVDGEDYMDPELAAAIAASIGHTPVSTNSGVTLNVKILACRCLSNLCVALPACVQMLIAQDGVKTLVALLGQMEFIDLTEQVLAVLRRVSADYPSQLLKHNGFSVVLHFVEFFSLHDQRTAVEIACNCARGLSYLAAKGPEAESALATVVEVAPILQRLASYDDAKVSESATKCLLRIIDWVAKTQPPTAQENLFLNSGLLAAIAALLKTFAHAGQAGSAPAGIPTVLKCLTAMLRDCPKAGLVFLQEFDGFNFLKLVMSGDIADSNWDSSVGSTSFAFQIEIIQFLQEILPALPQAADFRSCQFRQVWFWTTVDNVTEPLGLQHHSERVLGLKRKKVDLWSENPSLVDRFSQEMIPLLLIQFQSVGSSSVRRKIIQLVSQFLYLWPQVFADYAVEKRHLFGTKELAHAFGRFLADTISGIGREVIFSLNKMKQSSALPQCSRANDASLNGASAETVTLFCAVLGLVMLSLELDSQVFGIVLIREGVEADLRELEEWAKSLNALTAGGADHHDSQNPPPSSPSGSTTSVVTDDSIGENCSRQDALGSVRQLSSTAPNFSSAFGVAMRPKVPVFMGINGQAFDTKEVANWVDSSIATVLKLMESLDVHGAKVTLERLMELSLQLKQPLDSSDSAKVLRLVANMFACSRTVEGGDEIGATAYETLQSGILGSIVAFLSVDNQRMGPVSNEIGSIMGLEASFALPIKERYQIFISVFLNLESCVNGAFEAIVRRAQEALDQLDHFQVCVGCPNNYQSLLVPLFYSNAPLRSSPGRFAASSNSPTQLMKTVRIKLVADETGSICCVPDQYRVVIFCILAVADFRFLERFLLEKLGKHLESATDGNSSEFLHTGGSEGSTSHRFVSQLSEDGDGVHMGSETSDLSHTDEEEAGDSMDVYDAEDFGEPQPMFESVGSGSPSRQKKPMTTPRGFLPKSIEFYVGDLKVEQDWTIFGALYRAESILQQQLGVDGQADELTPVNIWSKTYSVRYKVVHKDAGVSSAEPEALQAANGGNGVDCSCAGASARDTLSEHGSHHEMHFDDAFVLPFNLSVPERLLKNEPLTWALLALRVLNGINNWEDNLFYTLEKSSDFIGASNISLKKELYLNRKIEFKFVQQLNEPLLVASNVLPSWCEIIAKEFPFLLTFEDRLLYLSSTQFGYARSISRWASLPSRGTSNESAARAHLSEFGRVARIKVRVAREPILDMMSKLMDKFGSSQALIEVEFYGEVGTGLGPTLEFYSLVWRQLQKAELSYKGHDGLTLWRTNGGVNPDGYVVTLGGLFPAPLNGESPMLLELFSRMGTAVAKALLDSRIVDLPLNSLFLRYLVSPSLLNVKSQRLRMRLLWHVDPSLAKALDFILSRYRAGDGDAISSLCLDLTYPGMPTLELVPGGASIALSLSNSLCYIDRVLALSICEGVMDQLSSFKRGFSRVFPIESLEGMFSAFELGSLLGSNLSLVDDHPHAQLYRDIEEKEWQVDKILACIHADHGYSATSPVVKWAAQMLNEFSPQERRQALTFITGASRLPIGGFSKLYPPLTIVLRPPEKNHKPDDYLPSVMTCVNYMKIPSYSSKKVLVAKFKVAMFEGQGSFHLS